MYQGKYTLNIFVWARILAIAPVADVTGGEEYTIYAYTEIHVSHTLTQFQ